MSRRSPRVRAQLTATVTPLLAEGALLVCRTRDISDVGLSLDVDSDLDPGTRVTIVIMDPDRGAVIELVGEVSRMLGGGKGVGVLLHEPPAEWLAMVAQRSSQPRETRRGRRLRILVVGDSHRQRGALALYVTSGWDVRFATDYDGAVEALRGFGLDAVVAELDAADPRWRPILTEIRRVRPGARRIVRGAVAGARADADGDLVHRFVERDGGLEALVDALTADLPHA